MSEAATSSGSGLVGRKGSGRVCALGPARWGVEEVTPEPGSPPRRLPWRRSRRFRELRFASASLLPFPPVVIRDFRGRVKRQCCAASRIGAQRNAAFPDLGIRHSGRWAFKRDRMVDSWIMPLVIPRHDWPIAQIKRPVPRAPGTAIEHSQFVRLRHSRCLHYRE